MSFWRRFFGVKPTVLKLKIDWLEVETHQRQINELVKQNSQLASKQAMIDYDKLIDSILKQLASGTTFADRLKSLRTKFPKEAYNQIWRAHIKRNELVHDPGSFVDSSELSGYLRAYDEAVSILRGLSIK